MTGLVGIYAPYTHNTVTAMACAVGDVVQLLGCDVEYVSSQSHDSDVHYRWDDRVRKIRSTQFDKWVRSCRSIIWFDIQPHKLRAAAKAGCRNILVSLWNSLSECSLEHLPLFDIVLSPHSGVFQMLRPHLKKEAHKLLIWDQGILLNRRESGLVDETRLKLLVVINGASVRDFGGKLLSVLHLLAYGRNALTITVAHTRQWPIRERQRVQELAESGRVKLLRNPNYRQRIEAIRGHDWLFCASTVAESWWDATEALSNGMPVICFDAQPYNELIIHGYNGAVLHCGVETSSLGAVSAIVDPNIMLEGLTNIVRSDQLLQRIQSKAWPDVENRVLAFRQVWRKVLDW